jgi:hypothetical protein
MMARGLQIAPRVASPGRGALPPTLKTCGFQRSPQDIYGKKNVRAF